jgi:hypothetical protein
MPTNARVHADVTVPQGEFLRSPTKFRAFVGGVGSGKTWAGALSVLRMPGGSRGLVIAPTYPMLRDASLHTFRELARPVIATHHETTMTTTLTNGTEILWRSADDPDRLRGPNLGWAWLDEAALMPQLVWDIVLGRLRREPGKAWITTTPRGQLNWVYEQFIKLGTHDFHITRCSTEQNTFLPPDFVQTLNARYRGQFQAQEVGGEFVDWISAPAYDGFSRSANARRGVFEQYYSPLKPIALCIDVNVSLLAWPVVQVHTDPVSGRSQPVVLCEIAVESPASIPEACRQFRLMFAGHVGGVAVYGDAAGNGRSAQTGQSDYDLVDAALAGMPSRLTWMVPRKNPPPRDRVQAVNTVLRGYQPGLGGSESLLIDADECPWLLRDLERVEWNALGTDVRKVTNRNDEGHTLTHASDGLGYWAVMESPVMQMAVAAKSAAAEFRGEARRYKPEELVTTMSERI